MIALRGECSFCTESTLFLSVVIDAALFKDFTGTLFMLSTMMVLPVESKIRCPIEALLISSKRQHSHCNLYVWVLFNGHIHLIEQLVQFLEGVIFKRNLSASFVTMFHFNPGAEMGGEFILYLFISCRKGMN